MSFKLKHAGVPALMKTLTAGQKNMVQSMRKAGKTEAADKIEAGIEKAPIKKGPGDKKHKTTQKLIRNESNTVIGTGSETGMTQSVGTEKGTKMMANKEGKLFNPDRTVKAGKNKDMMKSLIKVGNKVYGYTDPKTGKPVRFRDSSGKDTPFDVKEFKGASRVGGYYTGTGFKSTQAGKMAKTFFDYNTNIDRTHRSVDRARMIQAAQQSGDRIQYRKEKEKPTRTVKAAPRKLGVKGLAKKAAPKKYGAKAKKAAVKKYGCKKK